MQNIFGQKPTLPHHEQPFIACMPCIVFGIPVPLTHLGLPGSKTEESSPGQRWPGMS